MSLRRTARKTFIRDLTRPRHMAAVSAVIIGTTFMPLLGIPNVEELRGLQHAIEGFSDARADVLAPRRNDEAARERSSRAIIPTHQGQVAASRTYRTFAVQRPRRAHIESIQIDDLALPLPPTADARLSQPVELGEIPTAHQQPTGDSAEDAEDLARDLQAPTDAAPAEIAAVDEDVKD